MINQIDCFVVPLRNDVIAKPTQEAETISMREFRFNIIIDY
jgi:hypothetical protein